MFIRYICGNCGQKCKSAEEYAGLNVNCSQCGTLLKIPQPEIVTGHPIEVHNSLLPKSPPAKELQEKFYPETVEQIPVSETQPEPIITFESKKMPEASILKRPHPDMNTSGTPITSKEINELNKVNKKIKFICPGCSSSFEIDNTFAGKKIECGNCRTRFVVPSLEEIRAREVAERAAGASRLKNTPMPTARNTVIMKKMVADSNIKKQARPKAKNKFIEHVSRERMKYIICVFILLFTGVVIGLILKPNSSAIAESKAPEEVNLSLHEKAVAKEDQDRKRRKEQNDITAPDRKKVNTAPEITRQTAPVTKTPSEPDDTLLRSSNTAERNSLTLQEREDKEIIEKVQYELDHAAYTPTKKGFMCFVAMKDGQIIKGKGIVYNNNLKIIQIIYNSKILTTIREEQSPRLYAKLTALISKYAPVSVDSDNTDRQVWSEHEAQLLAFVSECLRGGEFRTAPVNRPIIAFPDGHAGFTIFEKQGYIIGFTAIKIIWNVDANKQPALYAKMINMYTNASSRLPVTEQTGSKEEVEKVNTKAKKKSKASKTITPTSEPSNATSAYAPVADDQNKNNQTKPNQLPQSNKDVVTKAVASVSAEDQAIYDRYKPGMTGRMSEDECYTLACKIAAPGHYLFVSDSEDPIVIVYKEIKDCRYAVSYHPNLNLIRIWVGENLLGGVFKKDNPVLYVKLYILFLNPMLAHDRAYKATGQWSDHMEYPPLK